MELKPISSAFLHVTNACNCRCRYCFETARPDYMKLDTAMDVTRFLIANAERSKAIPSINFFGGEPTLCWDSIIVPLTDWIRQQYNKPFQLSMTSNGVLLNDERLQYMKRNNIALLFSVDGDQETQDYNRPLASGGGSYASIAEVARLIPKYYPNTTFRSTVIPKTCGNTFHNIMFAEWLGYHNIFLMPNVLEEWPEDAKQTMSAEMRRYSDYFIQCFRDGRRPIRFSEYDKAFTKIQRINTAIYCNTYREGPSCDACGKCGLGSNRFAAIDFRGDIYGCQEMVCVPGSSNPFYIGNIYTGVDNQLREKLIRSYHKNAERSDHCKDCRLDRICDGGCVANNYFVTGDVNRLPPVYCWWLNLLLDEAIYVCNQMGDTPPGAFVEYWKEVHDGGQH